jgi:hypothetical protein
VRAAISLSTADPEDLGANSVLLERVIDPAVRKAGETFLANLDSITVEQMCETAEKTHVLDDEKVRAISSTDADPGRAGRASLRRFADGGFGAEDRATVIVGVETKSMVYKVLFQLADRETETLYWNGSLEETISLARSTAFECGFEEFRIIESAGSGAEVFSEKLPSAKHG